MAGAPVLSTPGHLRNFTRPDFPAYWGTSGGGGSGSGSGGGGEFGAPDLGDLNTVTPEVPVQPPPEPPASSSAFTSAFSTAFG